ncbi:conserved hypothetical protein [Bifidobacterium scardovii JCM 12489 = DSM 13734]|uniref:non-specific serine/threonine protein kinase n=2 Tax=Bifidobacterium scardovii TaxID=158787 RepID=A0A087D5B6_9BIFI|nr:protein kinase [Bifidobacterium scardovii]BAQ32634.1 conserved hypothetical protein [Bifidobacterium scardovii JCM 12489 = DSM 13734]
MSDLNALNLEPGNIVGGYTLVSRLGAGAMGSVWRVRDDGGQVYAMKILRDSLADDNATAQNGADGAGAEMDEDARERLTARERLRREAMALKKVNHPGVCGIVDMELDDSLAFIVTELIEGKNLRDDVKANGRYTGDDLERLARKLIEAVKAVHAAGIVHRDIKPTNVMVSASGPVLVDFGIAMSGGESHVTRTGLVMGTPGFIAPEIIEGEESDETTDWWSTASVLAFAATGTPVFGTKPMMAVLERAAAGNANLTGLPARTMAAFRAALDPDRRKRCTPDQLLHAIALDALNPFAWQDAETESGETEVVRPFDDADPDNPRVLWRHEPIVLDPRIADELATQTFPEAGNTAAMAPIAPTQRIDPGQPTASLQRTRPMSTADQNNAPANDGPTNDEPANRDLQETMANPDLRPAVQRLAGGDDGTAPPPASAPTASETAVLPEATSPMPTGTATSALPTAAAPLPPAIPPGSAPAGMPVMGITPGGAQVAAPFINMADLKRGLYRSRGMLPLWLATVPLAVLAAAKPAAAALAAIAVMWATLSVGYSVEAQLEREGRRGGERKRSDGLLLAASLPWHLIKALLAAVLRGVLMTAVMALIILLAGWALGLPLMHVDAAVGRWTLPLTLVDDVPLSASGLALGCGAAIGWILAAFAPNALIMRVGAGALRGLRPDAMSAAIPPAGGGVSRRGAVLLIVWAACTVAACFHAGFAPVIDWWPLAGDTLRNIALL